MWGLYKEQIHYDFGQLPFAMSLHMMVSVEVMSTIYPTFSVFWFLNPSQHCSCPPSSMLYVSMYHVLVNKT